ncbi:hypothetical protein GQR58_024454 [Nymphon striatum]|nr:hypothetical protein GQR58_024454 [Nymphon striatum]
MFGWCMNGNLSTQKVNRRVISNFILRNKDNIIEDLGKLWELENDNCFGFQIARSEPKMLSRRVMLSVVSSMFDPLGLVNPILISGKLLLQEATRRKLSWDEIELSSCTIFCDSSSEAYGSCSYLRCIDKTGRISVHLIMSKCRVAPIRSPTLPRLELQGAVLAAKLDGLLKEKLDIVIDESYFWSDSEIVLKYLSNEKLRFHVYVGNRVNTILGLTHPRQWNYIKGKSNPADLLTRPQTVEKSELRRSLSEISKHEIEQYAVRHNIEWHFNPPSASHMGGAWERIIRSIRRILSGMILEIKSLTDETLDTLFCEIESILNGRPLTKLSDDVLDPTPLTPNHLLMLKEGPSLPPGKFDEDICKKGWRHVQHLSNVFWRRWLRVYLPELQRRQNLGSPTVNNPPPVSNFTTVNIIVRIMAERTERANAKRNLTRKLNEVRRMIAENDVSFLDQMENVKTLFKKFMCAHESCCEASGDDDIEINDLYFEEMEEKYIKTLNLATNYSDISSKISEPILGGKENVIIEHVYMPKVDDFKLARLLQYTSGVAKEAIRGCQLIGGDTGYQQARSILQERFGNKYLVTERVMQDLKCSKPVRTPFEIQSLADKLRNASLILNKLNTEPEINSQSSLIQILSRMPQFVQIKWKTLALENKRSKGVYPNFEDFVKFVADIAEEMNDPVYGQLDSRRYPQKDNIRATTNVTATSKTPPIISVDSTVSKCDEPCVMCNGVHKLWHCADFKKKSPQERLDLVKFYNLCHNCLSSFHKTEKCGKKSICFVKGCGKKHTMYIHVNDNSDSFISRTPISNNTNVSDISNTELCGNICMPIVKVCVNDNTHAYALLDTASSNSFCTKRLKGMLNVSGISEYINLSTMNMTNSIKSEVIQLKLSSEEGESLKMGKVFVIDDIPVQNVNLNVIDILIGQDYAEALMPLEVRRGSRHEPFAVRTMFGWCMNGNLSTQKVNRRVISNFILRNKDNIIEDLGKLWELENDSFDKISWSEEDKRVIELWEREIKVSEGHFVLPIPFRDKNETIPNNFIVAKFRLDALMKKLCRKNILDKYTEEIKMLIDNGYAEVIPLEEVDNQNRIWYLPHHAVINDKKPGKLRIVFDCASKYKDKSLNDRCMQGPNLTNNLLDVLLRFRQYQYAVQADGDRSNLIKEFGSESEGKVLGIKWNILSDCFGFQIARSEPKMLSRRVMLSVVSSMFDPLGLVNPILISGKLLLQEATRRKLSWDEIVPRDIELSWKSWLDDVEEVKQLKIARCFKPISEAYGSCSYLRCIDKTGRISVHLIMSKCRVAPIRSPTLPRLELQGAVLAAKLDGLLKEKLDIVIDESYFWSDSEIVLKYLSNEKLRFHVYVGNRVNTILGLTHPRQWNYIKGKSNPADLLTRPQTVESMHRKQWFRGPQFLNQYKDSWNLNNVYGQLSEQDPQVKRSKLISNVHMIAMKNPENIHVIDSFANYYSDWYKMRRAVAYWFKYIDYLGKVKISAKLSVCDIKNAEKAILKHVQQECFQEELKQLNLKGVVSKRSSIRSLCPFLDADGLIKVGGRIMHSSDELKHALIISHKHPVARLIITDVHKVAHLGSQWVLSIVRRKYWVTKGMSTVKSVLKKCVTCKRLYANTAVQKMANLPQARMDAYKPAFTNTGIDIFGPFYVKHRRSQVKRYGCIFTCMTTRAVHLEKVYDLSTNSFINGFRRFVCRRGYPEKVYSDNGTNFVGGESELRRSLSEISKHEIEQYAVRHNIEWHFNPPSASHMGGAWERIIRSIRRILSGMILKIKSLTDETLDTLFCEIESILNGRPLTKLSDDVLDPTPLTPNHLLMLKEGPSLPPGKFDEDICKKGWRHVQHLSNVFWRRWLRVYLPELQRRQKWLDVKDNMKKGNLVIIVNESTPRNLWPLAIVTEVLPSSDGLVRSVKVKTKSSEFVRPITKLVLLENSSDA